MKKLAIFVEGQTEAQFLYHLLLQVIGEAQITIAHEKLKKGNHFIIVETHDPQKTSYYVLIRDCSGDGGVKTKIVDGGEKLIESGYEKILGLRDVFRHPISEAQKLKIGINKDLPDTIPTKIILAIHEVEAWFIAEHSHFTKINSKLTKDFIETSLSININPGNVETIEHPSKVLNDIYQLIGRSYNKKKYTLPHTIQNLDFAEMFFVLPNEVSSLNDLISELNIFFGN